MDNHHLRSLLLNLYYRLSVNDRDQLYFYLKNKIPGTISDGSTLSGTLKLMQSLFDQDKINDHNFTLLINAFKQIQCSDAVQLLKEHQQRMLLNDLNSSTQSSASIKPSIIGELMNDYEKDKVSTNKFILNHINYSNNNNKIMDSNNITINRDTQKVSSLRQRCLCIPWMNNTYFLVSFVFFLLALGSLIYMLIETNDDSKYSENNSRINDDLNVQTQNLINQMVNDFNKTLIDAKKKNNATGKQFKKLLLEKNSMIKQLNQQLNKIQDERKTFLIKPGRIFGGNGGADFDDSSIPMFTSFHYLSGFRCSDLENFEACQFIYSSARNNHSRIESLVHGTHGRPMNKSFEYHLNNDDERIQQVRVGSVLVRFLVNDGITYHTTLIKGIQFVTENGRMIPPNIDLINYNVETEYIPGYTLGYVTGKSGLRIDQLQFFWYRAEEYEI